MLCYYSLVLTLHYWARLARCTVMLCGIGTGEISHLRNFDGSESYNHSFYGLNGLAYN